MKMMMMMMKENKKTTSGFVSDFSDKVAAPTTTAETTTTSCSSGDGLCLKLQRTESFPYKSSTSSSSSSSSSRMMMMNQHHSNQGVFGGPTFVNGINEGSYETAFNGGGFVLGGGGGGGGGEGGVASTRTLLQPFYSAFKSPAGGVGGIGGMATAYLRFPFTTAQWQELEQQALIYKYMMASVPIPPDLLIPISRNLSEATTTTTTAPTLIGVGRGGGGGGHRSSSSCFNLRFSNNTDPEPGRCRRTDGKKWRCSRDVAPDQKYCERHMHRGRPRSRKHVEAAVVQQQQTQMNNNNNNNSSSTNINNKMMMFNNHLSSVPPPTTSTTTTTTNKSSSYCGFSSKSDFKVPPFESMASPRTFKDHNRSMEWMMRGGETVPVSVRDQVQWGNNQNQFMNSKPEMRNPSSSFVFQQQYHQTPNLNSYTDFGTNEAAQNQCCLYLNPEFSSLDESLSSDHHHHHHHRETPRRFIDAWSNARDSSTSNKPRESNKSSSSSLSSGFGNQKFSPSSLTLSMSGCNSTTTGEEIDEIQMGLGVIDSDHNNNNNNNNNNNTSIKSQPLSWMTPASSWMTSLPGGPLGEVLQSSTAAIHGCSNINSRSSCLNLMSEGWGGGGGHETSSSPRLTSISSPSGVLQKTFASLSDSSGNSSPNSLPVAAAAKSEIALQLLNQSRLPSSS